MGRLKKELDKDEYVNLEGMMWILRSKHECLNNSDKEKLRLLYHYSPILKKAHKYAIKLTQILNTHCTRKSGMAKISRWIKSVEKSHLSCFGSFIKTLKKYQPYISNYFKARKNSGFVEGLNNKIKVAKRRCDDATMRRCDDATMRRCDDATILWFIQNKYYFSKAFSGFARI